MPFGTYDELVTTIEDWLAREDFREQVADFIYLAEKQMSTLAKLRLVDKIEEGTLTEGQDYITTPADMIEPRLFRTNGNPPRTVNIVSIWKHQDVAARNATAEPSSAFHHGNRIYLAGTPGADETSYTLFYRGGFPRLSSQVQTNFILEQFPMCYLYTSLANAAPYIGNDERAPQWIEQAQFWVRELRKSEAKARTGGGRLRIRPDSVPGGAVSSGIRNWPW